MHTNLKAVALFIVAAIYPLVLDDEVSMDWEQRCDILYDTVGTLLFTDEQKADLYARLAEQLEATTTHAEAIHIVERAIHACQYPG